MEIDDAPALVVPARGLVVLIGASGAGKTTFAARHFEPTEVLSSDLYRALVGDDEGDQSASPAAFDILQRVLAHRLRRGRLSIVDATNVHPAVRRTLVGLAAAARRPAVAIVLDLPEQLCQERNRLRAGRSVDPAVVRRHVEAVRRTLADPQRLLAEGYVAVYILDSPRSIEQTRVVRDAALVAPRRPSPPPGRRVPPRVATERPAPGGSGDTLSSARRSVRRGRTA